MSPNRKRSKSNDLSRDEIWSPDPHHLPGEWDRDNTYFFYRLFRGTGWAGRTVGLLLALVLLSGIVLGIYWGIAALFAP